MKEVSSQHMLAESMKNVTRAMVSLNRQINMPELKNTLMEFQKQSEMMEMKQEMMDDVMGDALEDEEEESEQVVNAVLDEIGISMNEQLSAAPVQGQQAALKAPAQKEKAVVIAGVGAEEEKAAPVMSDEDKALEERLARLKK